MKKKVGVIGLGDMGIGLAQNLLKSDFEVTGFDLREERLELLKSYGGIPAKDCLTVAENSETVFVMVMNGKQAYDVVAGPEGLLTKLKPGSTVCITATIKASEIKLLEEPCKEKEVYLIDTPVSGGKSGADGGTLTLMASAPIDVIEKNRSVLEAVSGKIFHVGEEIGQGQITKASLQALIGSTFTAIFESLVLGSKAGIKGEVLYDVFTNSGVASPLLKNCGKLIMDRAFEGTGSHIGTMHKDLGITMDMAKENGCSMFTTAAAYELFQAGISLYPKEDNWCITKLLEQIADTEVKW